MKRADLVRHAARQLAATEDAIEHALCECARLAQVLGEGRMAAGLSAVTGQEAVDGMAVLYKRLARARRDAVKLHHALDAVKTQIGARSIRVGAGDDKPSPAPLARLDGSRTAIRAV